MNADGVFEGGGVRGLALVGAAEVAEERGCKWVNLAGTSAGAIIASLLAAGYQAHELLAIMEQMDLLRFVKRTGFARVPFVGPIWALWMKNGIASTRELHAWLEELLLAKGVRYFGDLAMPRSIVEHKFHRYRLSVVVSDVTRRKMIVLPHDLPEYGLDRERFPVAEAVCMSATVPLLFRPMVLGNSYVVDGGLLSNFPIWIFDSSGIPQWPTFGFRLGGTEKLDAPVNRCRKPSLPQYLKQLGQTLFQGNDAFWEDETRARSMIIPTGDIDSFNFGLNEEEKQWLVQSGRETARKFFDRFKFQHYVQTFRLHVRGNIENGVGNDGRKEA